MSHKYSISAYVNYLNYENLEDGQYVRIELKERHLPSEIFGQIISSDPNLNLTVKFVKYLDTTDDNYWLIMLCGGEGSSNAEIQLLDEIQYRLMIA